MNMKKNRIKFDDYDELAQYMLDDAYYFDDEKKNDVALIADSFECAEVLARILSLADEYVDEDSVSIMDIELMTSDDRPYLITIDADGGIWCEPATTTDGKMLLIDVPVVYARGEYLENAKRNMAENYIVYEYALQCEDFDDEEEDVPCFTPLTDENDFLYGFMANLEKDGKSFCGMYCVEKPINTQEQSKDIIDFYNLIVHKFELM